ncbi:ankyrin repeat domain-containing protein [Haliscomenobacter sp.]|uniref:ankyrin repeat domain-containing protein n=1 Tax=Haliscomenobacter sp. TaxID=2717303 RepID=UPI003593C73B
MASIDDFVGYIELHDVMSIQNSFKNGLDPNSLFRGEPLIFELTSEYTRGARFTACAKAFVDAGLALEDSLLPVILQDDAVGLAQMLQNDPGLLHKKHTLRCAYTPLLEASLLHLCAEYNLLACAKVLIEAGLSVDTPAGLDEHGLGGQTPIFHTVNQNGHQSKAVFELLLNAGANLQYQVKGLIWGQGSPWETLIPAVNPISYAMMGLLPQMHRDEETIAEVVGILMKAAYGIEEVVRNVPNVYLKN